MKQIYIWLNARRKERSATWAGCLGWGHQHKTILHTAGGGGRTFLFSYDKSLNCSHSLLPPPRLFFHSVPVHNLSLPGDSYKETEVHRLPIPHTRVTLQPDFLPSFHTRTVHLVSSSHSSIASKSTYSLEKHIFSQVGQVHLLEENPQSFLNHSCGLEHQHRLLCWVLKQRILAPDFAIVSPNKIKTVFVFFYSSFSFLPMPWTSPLLIIS